MSKIKYVSQVEGENMLIVHYKSGTERYVGLGDSYYNLTKTQRDFMSQAKKYESKSHNIWGFAKYYWFIENPHNENLKEVEK